MQASIWVHPWDLEGWPPAAFVPRLREIGVASCSLALAYHATRMILPTHRSRRMLTTDVSTAYVGGAAFPNGASLDGTFSDATFPEGTFTPIAGEAAPLVPPFLDACQRDGFPVRGWVVLCHQDGAGRVAPHLCMVNVYGERLDYALCPSQPAVRAWCAALCARAAALPGIEALDVEAAAFMGLEHQSAHDKRGVPLPPPIAWLLSICVCPACRASLGAEAAEELATRARRAIDSYLANWTAWTDVVSMDEALTVWLGQALFDRLLAMREQALRELLAAIRSRTGDTPLWIRLAGSRLFTGGKTALPLEALRESAHGAVMTWLGAPIETMTKELAALPPRADRAVPIRGGFTLHAPDCRREADVAARLRLLRDADVDEAIAYCYGLATDAHLEWLRAALRDIAR